MGSSCATIVNPEAVLPRFLRATPRLTCVCVGLHLLLPVRGQGQVPVPAPDSAGPTAAVPAPQPPAPAKVLTGRIAGRVVDRATGRPLASARILVVGQASSQETDLDGRYRTAEVPAGLHSVRAMLIGYAAVQQDSVRVTSGQATVVNFALTAAAVELQELVVEAAPVQQASSAAGLLAIQQAAPTVMDGISSEVMSRSPDSDASDAIARVTGVSVVDDKFVVVRGLSERYGNTLLNGVELPSPEPTRRIVPLDLFPASLLESIVTTKAGRPDRPGDFTGALVEIQTKEFPENSIFQVTASQEYNSLATFETVARADRGFTDLLGFDGRHREPAGRLLSNPELASTPAGERFAESIRNVWTPTGQAPLNYGLGVNLGGLVVAGDNPLGGVFSLNYSSKTEHIPERLYQFANNAEGAVDPILGAVFRQTATVVDWGAILNFTQRFGSSSKVSLKNLYSRNAEESFFSSRAFNTDNDQVRNTRAYQARYVERDLLQSQLVGEHFLTGLLNSRVEWKASYARAGRDEPENRNLRYFLNPDGTETFLPFQARHYFFFRFLDDRIYTGQLDWGIPLSLRGPADAEIKVGILYRDKARDFQAQNYRFSVADAHIQDQALLSLPPEQIFAPENIGTSLIYTPLIFGEVGPTYQLDETVKSGYAMLDLPVLSRVRLVTGVRMEDWRLDLFNGSRDAPIGAPISRTDTDPLWSANLTIGLSDRMNLRFGGYRSVARPEGRELSPAYFEPIGGECGVVGNPDLVRTTVTNADARWELFPSPGELLSVSGFYKRFRDPIFEQIAFTTVANCEFRYANAESARNYGVELEFRKSLGFLGGVLRDFSLGANFTYVDTESKTSSVANLDTGPDTLVLHRQFVGQSPVVFNTSLAYDNPDIGLQGSVLLNYFDDRVNRYGAVTATNTEQVIIPDVIELGRTSLDAKLQKRLGRLGLSLSGKNLLNSTVRLVQRVRGVEVPTGAYEVGVTVGIGLGYDF